MTSRPLVTVVSWVVAATVGAVALALLVVPAATGSSTFAVLTGSMEPTYPPGTVVVVHPTPMDRLRIGDVVTFQARPDRPAMVTHRVVALRFAPDGTRMLLTRGDANGATDPRPVRAEQVRGRVWYGVPHVGRLTTMVDPEVRVVAARVLALLLLGYGAHLVVSGARTSLRGRAGRPVVGGPTAPTTASTPSTTGPAPVTTADAS